MIKKFVMLLACISTLCMGFVFLISSYDSSIALRRKMAATFYELGFETSARKIWEVSVWAGDNGSAANLALLDYRDYNLNRFRNPEAKVETWYKKYVQVDDLLSSIPIERDTHDFNRAILRFSWPQYPEWLQSAVKQFGDAEKSGNEIAAQALRAYEKSGRYQDVYRALADNGDIVAAYHVANQIHFNSDKDQFEKYFNIAKSGNAKYFSGYDFVRADQYKFSPEIEKFKYYAKDGYINAKYLLASSLNEKFYASCHYGERETCDVEEQNNTNILLEESINYDCTNESTKFRTNDHGLIILNISDEPILYNCLNNARSMAIQLATRVYLGIGANQNKAKAKSILDTKLLSDHPYSQMLLATLNQDQKKANNETLKMKGYFEFTPDQEPGASIRLVEAGLIRPVTFLDFENWSSNYIETDVDEIWTADNLNPGYGFLWTTQNMKIDDEGILAKTQRKFVVEASPESLKLAEKWPDRLILLRRQTH